MSGHSRPTLRAVGCLVLLAAGATALANYSIAAEDARSAAPAALLMKEADDAFNRGDYSRASELLYRFVSNHEGNALAWLRLGRALGKSGAFEDAWRAYDKAIELALIAGQGADARGIEAEARVARAAIALDVAMADITAARRIPMPAVTRASVDVLESQLVAAREFRSLAPATPRAVSQVRAVGKVMGPSGPVRTATPVEVIRGGVTTPKSAAKSRAQN
jgi:tetratricopeptide (TPR) repeat protein